MNPILEPNTLLPFILLALVLIFFAKPLYPVFVEMKIRQQIHQLADNTLILTPEQFFKLRNRSIRGERGIVANRYNFAGVYILHNQTKDQYYVGQAKRILNRVNNHFTGKGNGDVYADYKYGDKWTIRMIALDESPFQTLNELERYAIQAYDAYTKGYNKNRGIQ